MKENENQTETKWKVLPYIQGVTDLIGKKLKKEGIQTAFKSNRTIKNLIWNAKQKNNKWEQEGIYKINCECGKNYIGITERKLSIRVAEHKRCVKNYDTNNAIAIHSRQDCEKKILWDDVKIIAKESTTKKKYLYESMAIYKEIIQNKSMNIKKDTRALSYTWKMQLNNQNNNNNTCKNKGLNSKQLQVPDNA